MLALAFLAALATSRSETPLDGTWTIETVQDPTPRSIRVPDAFESALGDDFDGIATYRTEFSVAPAPTNDRWFLEFDAVATYARVFVNDVEVGSHLGGWTKFRCEITNAVKSGPGNALRVDVDERVGHDTQGFLPIVAPHFGGIWQSVRLVHRPQLSLDEDRVLLFGDFERHALEVEAPLLGDGSGASVTLEGRLADSPLQVTLGAGRTSVPVANIAPWSPGHPKLYSLSLVVRDAKGVELDRITRQVGFRTLRADGKRLLLNGVPLNIRGVLEWGYYPPERAPNRSREQFVRQVREAKARGFNLIKFCLWVPPARLLEALDELGMLAWIEYPTWHPKFDEATRATLFGEFDEFFHHDRNHPGVVVRSLTCETGHGAPLEVLKALYDRAHAVIPNALVEDDSSWIEWHRIHDFYDDHPYGNNDTWLATLDRLGAHVDAYGAKPLLLGEAIAADTWLDRSTMRDALPHYRPIALDALDAWEARIAQRFGQSTIDRLTPESLRYCLNERKDQIETFRIKQPDAGYVVSVARDFRLASMGLADAFDRWKWRTDEWAWHGDTQLLLDPRTPRSLRGGESIELGVWIAHHGEAPIPAGRLTWRLGEDDDGVIEHDVIEPGQVVRIGTIELDPPDVYASYELPLELRIGSGASERTNRFVFHVVPMHVEFDDEHEEGDDHDHAATLPGDAVIEVNALSPGLIERIRAGRNVLLTVRDEPGSFVAPKHWMLRGSLWMPAHPLLDELSRNFFLDLCVHELHPTGLVPLRDLFDHVDPIVSFFDTHDRAVVDDFGLLFETRVGDGRLMVSTLPLTGSPAAEHLRRVLREHLAGGRLPKHSLPDSLIEAMKSRLVAESIDLTAGSWQMRPEPQDGPLGEWKTIQVGQAWEGQGFPNLDGRVRYRLEVEVPGAWNQKPLWLQIDGVDDAYWVSFDGAECGHGGDVDNRTTAFDTPASHRLSDAATPGRHLLEIVVLDWYGAGGLHRPLRLSTAPRTESAEFLRAK